MRKSILVILTILVLACLAPSAIAQSNEIYKYLGNLSANEYDPNSISNSLGRFGSQLAPDSINKAFGQYGSRFSPNSVNNPFATDSSTPMIFGSDGKYLGRLSSNPYGQYGSRYSPYSANNLYAISPPKIIAPSSNHRLAPIAPLPQLKPLR